MARTDLPYLKNRLKELNSDWDNLQRTKYTSKELKAHKASLLRTIEYVESSIKKINEKRNKYE